MSDEDVYDHLDRVDRAPEPDENEEVFLASTETAVDESDYVGAEDDLAIDREHHIWMGGGLEITYPRANHTLQVAGAMLDISDPKNPVLIHGATEGEVVFLVKVRTAEVNPEWADGIEKRLRRECKYLFGKNFDIERQVDWK